MSERFFPSIDRWRLPEAALQAALAELQIDGREGNEGVALWLGQRGDGIAEISHVVLLRGVGISKHPKVLRIADWLLNDVADLTIELELTLIGQIHSHGSNWTDLSITDRSNGITAPYYLSVVAPHFGLCPGTRMEDCGVHIFEPIAGWRRLSVSEIGQRIEIVADRTVTVHIVGRDEL